MQSALRISTRVQLGGRVEITDSQLLVGQSVDVIVLLPIVEEKCRHSIMDVLTKVPGHLAFKTAEEADAYLREEREAWER
ncbi:hypothetical protein LBMAG21_05890 [Armatimonadota bacterium]|nr:hypothetical protein LBMAG21_05890 [Armatimonadota bacterium]